MRSLRILSTPTAQRSSAPFIAHCLPLPYLCSVQVVPGIPVSHPPPPSHRRSRLSPTSMGSLDLGAAQEDRRHSRRRTRSSSGFLLLPCRMGLLAGDILPSHPQVMYRVGIYYTFFILFIYVLCLCISQRGLIFLSLQEEERVIVVAARWLTGKAGEEEGRKETGKVDLEYGNKIHFKLFNNLVHFPAGGH
uniref:Uncharacterized protein n=1 Tax=Oryza nivara TaxID=4536 RepID=A0A0E0HS75_ORYNI